MSAVILLLLAAIAAAAGPGARALALSEAMVAAIGPRPSGTVAAQQAQGWVEVQLAARGWHPWRLRGRDRDGVVLACREGQRPEVVLFLAHTDTVHARVPGANDNAAAVAVLLVLAEQLEQTPPERTVCLGFPDGEEVGLRGSTRLAAAVAAVPETLPGPLDQVMALDLVGRGRLTHNGLGPAWSASSLRALLRAAPAEVPWVYRGLSQGGVLRERSDHGPFAERGVLASHLMARAEAGVYLAYHTEQDGLDQLQQSTLASAVNAVSGVARMPPPPSRPADAAGVVPWLGWVWPGWVTWLGLASGLLGVLLAVRIPDTLKGGGVAVLHLLGRSVAGGAAAWVVMSLILAGRSGAMALAPWMCAGAWLAWAAAVVAWPAPDEPTPRMVGALWAAVLAGCLAAVGAPLLGLPFALTALCVGLSRWSAVPALLALWVPVYLVRPDAVRELAFHGLVDGSPGTWAVLLAALCLPAVGALPPLEPTRRRPVLIALGVAMAVCLLGGWLSPEYAAPYVEHLPFGPGG